MSELRKIELNRELATLTVLTELADRDLYDNKLFELQSDFFGIL